MALKKVFTALMAALMIFSVSTVALAAAEEFDAAGIDVRAYILIDASTGRMLTGKNIDEKNYPASTTKIITSMVAIENGDIDGEITVGSEVNVGSGESAMGLTDGETITLKDLLYGLMLPSGNDAAKAIAVAVGGSVEGFVDMMNAKAAELGMNDTHFVNPHGAKPTQEGMAEEHYTTAADLAIAARYAYRNDTFKQIVGTAEYTTAATNKASEGHKLRNSNKLITKTDSNGNTNSYYLDYATGVKTGSTPQAGKCLVASAEKDGSSLICVILGDDTDAGNERWGIAERLFEYGFENYKSVDLSFILEGAQPVSVKVENAAASDEGGGYLELVPTIGSDGAIMSTVTRDEADAITAGTYQSSQQLDTITAPVAEGDICGKIKYTINGEEFFEVNLVASRNVSDVTGELSADASPVKTQEPIAVDTLSEKSISPWWWLLIPLVLIIILLIRIIYVKRRRRRRARGRSNYRY